MASTPEVAPDTFFTMRGEEVSKLSTMLAGCHYPLDLRFSPSEKTISLSCADWGQLTVTLHADESEEDEEEHTWCYRCEKGDHNTDECGGG